MFTVYHRNIWNCLRPCAWQRRSPNLVDDLWSIFNTSLLVKVDLFHVASFYLALELLSAMCGMQRPALAHEKSHFTTTAKKTHLWINLADWHVRVNSWQSQDFRGNFIYCQKDNVVMEANLLSSRQVNTPRFREAWSKTSEECYDFIDQGVHATFKCCVTIFLIF